MNNDDETDETESTIVDITDKCDFWNIIKMLICKVDSTTVDFAMDYTETGV